MAETPSPPASGPAPEVAAPSAPPLPAVEAALRERFSDAIVGKSDFRGTLILAVATDRLKDVLRFLRDDPAMAFDMLLDIVTIDWYEYEGGRDPRFDVVYNLLSLSRQHRVQIRVSVSEDAPVLPTVIDIWAGANWFEREAFDMMGISFTGHPNLARLLTHPGFTGHALRKDYAADKRQPFAPPLVVVPHA